MTRTRRRKAFDEESQSRENVDVLQRYESGYSADMSCFQWKTLENQSTCIFFYENPKDVAGCTLLSVFIVELISKHGVIAVYTRIEAIMSLNNSLGFPYSLRIYP